jgi:hypothetical protein
MVGPLGGNQGFPAVHLKENCSFLYSGLGHSSRLVLPD